MASLYVPKFICLFATISLIYGYVPVTKNMKSFTSALKQVWVNSSVEYTVYENTNGSGIITELWFTGSVNENTILRIYVDNDYTTKIPSIECRLYMCHNIGYTVADEVQYIPWSTKRVGHQAQGGGLYNTYQIPFGKQIRITLEIVAPPNIYDFYFMARGALNYPLILGNLLLPNNARLRLFKNEDVILQPLDMLTLVNISNTSGALLQVFMAASSSTYNYIEGCYRVKIDNDKINNHEYQFLSSGVEDFYLSGFAFDKGVYHGDNSGCTYIKGGPQNTKNITMAAYKFFENDPILFTESLSLLWKCGSNGDCPSTWPPNKGDIYIDEDNKNNYKADQPTKVTTYTWVYTYQF